MAFLRLRLGWALDVALRIEELQHCNSDDFSPFGYLLHMSWYQVVACLPAAALLGVGALTCIFSPLVSSPSPRRMAAPAR